MTYDELRGNIIAYEQNHIKRHAKEEKKKSVAFNVSNHEDEEHEAEEDNEGYALINHGVIDILRQRRQRPQQG